MIQAFEDEALAIEGRNTVNEFDGFLNLDTCDDRGDCGRGGNFSFLDFFVGEEVAGHPRLRIAQSTSPKRAFVAGRAAGQEDAGDAVDAFDGAINPGAIDDPGSAIDPEASFAIVETGENYIAPGEEPRPHSVVTFAVRG